MFARSTLFAVGAFCFLTTLALAQTPDANDARVATLVKKLGSGSYQARESARKGLESLGADSLDTLRKARASIDTDVETLRRLDDVIFRFELQLLTKQILTPKEVHLVLKDATPPQAIAELAKVSGYPIQFQGDATKFANKKLTLDIKAPFWRVLDRINQDAGLVERADSLPQDLGDPRFGNVRVMRGGIARVYSPNTLVAPAGPIVVVPRTTEQPRVDFAGAVKTEVRVSRDPKSQDLIVELTAGIEPRLVNGMVAGKPALAKIADGNGRTLEAMPDQAVVDGITTGGLIPGVLPRRNSVQFRFKNPGDALNAIKELVGQWTVTVDLQNEVVAKLPNILNATGKSASGSNGGDLTVVSIKKTPAGDFEVTIAMNGLTPNPFGNNVVINGGGGVIIRGNVVINGAIVIGPNGVQMGGSGNRKDLPDLVDATGQKFQILAVTADNTSISNTGVSRAATIVYRPSPGQGEPRDLILFGTRNHAIAVPFRFENVAIPSKN